VKLVKSAVKVFKALADPSRVRIVKMLQEKPLCVCEITSILGLATSTVSKHLSLLRDAGLITDAKDSKWVNYKIADRSANPAVRDALALVRAMLENDDTVKTDRRKAAAADRNRICGLETPSYESSSAARSVKT
jgi:DNA-binding transcriptional ArsR family regulator